VAVKLRRRNSLTNILSLSLAKRLLHTLSEGMWRYYLHSVSPPQNLPGDFEYPSSSKRQL
jgi:hypothetical protein